MGVGAQVPQRKGKASKYLILVIDVARISGTFQQKLPVFMFLLSSRVRAGIYFIMKVVRSIPRMAIYTTNCDISQLRRKHSSRSGPIYYP